jgi:hypothetical protein
VLGLSIGCLATYGAFHFASAARAASDSLLARVAFGLACLDAAALLAAALGWLG